MDLSKDGQQVLMDLIFKQFNEDNIDIIAKCGCSNQCEAFWGQSIKYSEGKRILGYQTDLWYTMLQLCFCNSNGKYIERTRDELARLLNIEISVVEKRFNQVMKRRQVSD